MAVAIAVTLTKKLDELTHAIGIGSLLLFISVFGFPAVDVTLLAVLLLAGIIDEVGNDITDRKNARRAFKMFFENRLSLEVAAFLVSAVTGEWIIWISMASFDIGYNATSRLKAILRRRGLL